jgi:uncharacterized membrane protein
MSFCNRNGYFARSLCCNEPNQQNRRPWMEVMLIWAGLVLGLYLLLCPIIALMTARDAQSRITELERTARELKEKVSGLTGELAKASVGPASSTECVPPIEKNADRAATGPHQAGQWTGDFEQEALASADSIPGLAVEADLSPWPAWVVKMKTWLLGGNLVAKVGLLILFLGVGFLLKYAAARFTVPIEYRLLGIILADMALLSWAWRIRESRPAISLPVQGSALAIAMLVTFGSYKMYGLFPGGVAFALLFALTAFTCLLAVLQDAVWLAVFGIAGGFATPILASTGGGSHIFLFSYYAILNTGILAIALYRSWRLLNVVGFAFTFIIGTAWGVLRYAPEHYLSVQLFLMLFFIYYVSITLLYASRQAPNLKHYVDGTLVFGTPLVAFGLQYGLVKDMAYGLAYSSFGLGLFYIALALYLWQRRGTTLHLLTESFLALGSVFVTLAIPFALNGRWTSAVWALEGSAIIWVGLRQGQTLAWMFGLLVQFGAWLSFLGSDNGLGAIEAGQSLFAGTFLGALLIALGALSSSWAFHRQNTLAFSTLSRRLLFCSGFWWFGFVLNDWAEWLQGQYKLLLQLEPYRTDNLFRSAYALSLAAFAPGLAYAAKRLGWRQLRWHGASVWIALGLSGFAILWDLYINAGWPYRETGWAYLALWGSGEWLLAYWRKSGWTITDFWLKTVHTLRTAAPWMMIWPVGRRLLADWLYTDTPNQQEWSAQAYGSTAGSWSHYLPAWVMMLAIVWVIRQTRTQSWPAHPLAHWYRRVLIPLAVGWSVCLVALWNLCQNGIMPPLPYLPMLNPLDLTTGFSLYLGIEACRLLREQGTGCEQPAWVAQAPWFAGLSCYVWFNLMLLRSVAVYMGIPYQFQTLFDTQFVQTLLSLVWSGTALVVMRVAAHRVSRKAWMLGALLLGVVVAKLFLVDLANIGGLERVVSFVGVGLLMLAIGYLAPFPNEPDKYC